MVGRRRGEHDELVGPSSAPSAKDDEPQTSVAIPEGDLRENLQRYERCLIEQALAANDWNRTKTAKQLGLPYRTLTHKIKTLGITDER